MKRFYCSICNRIKRVRTLPPLRGSVAHTFKSGRQNLDVPVGQCRYHNEATEQKWRLRK